MKKLTLSILAAGIAALTLASCAGDGAVTNGSSGNSSTPAATTTEAPNTTETPNTTGEPTSPEGTTTGAPQTTEPEVTTTETTDPTTPPDVPEDLGYAIDVDITIVDGNAGIVFSGVDTNNFLMWQLAIGEKNDGNLYLRPHTWTGGGGAVVNGLEIVINDIEGLEEISTELGTTYHMTVRVYNDGSIETLINDVSVNTTDLLSDRVLTDDPGLVGIRCDAYNNGTIPEVGIFDNLKIVDGTGKVLYEDDFSDEDSYLCSDLVDGNQAVLEDGALKVTGKYLRMTYVTD